MKKSLVALAALAATSAFAQVTLTGNMDFAHANVSGQANTYQGNTVTQLGYTASTSFIGVKAIEDLGNGLKAEAFYELDPRALATDGGALGRHQSYVALMGGFGTLKLGAPNSLGLAAFGASSPLGTGIGSGYAPGGNNTGATNIVSTRWSRSAQYSSPSFAGFTVSFTYAPGVDETAAPAASATANGIPQGRSGTELGLSYSNGPLNIAFVNVANGEFRNGATNGAGAAANSAKTSANVLAANYKLGSTTVYAGYFNGDIKGATTAVATAAATASGSRFAVKQNMGSIDLSASYQRMENKTAATKEVVTGLRADYNLSKTTAAYIGYESWDNFGVTNTRNVTAVGVRKAF